MCGRSKLLDCSRIARTSFPALLVQLRMLLILVMQGCMKSNKTRNGSHANPMSYLQAWEEYNSLRWSKVRSIERQSWSFDSIVRLAPLFISPCEKTSLALVSKNHTRGGKKCDSVNNTIRLRAVSYSCYNIEQETKKALCVRDNVLRVLCSSFFSWFAKSINRIPTSPIPPDILPGASRTDKIYYFSCISPSHPPTREKGEGGGSGQLLLLARPNAHCLIAPRLSKLYFTVYSYFICVIQ